MIKTKNSHNTPQYVGRFAPSPTGPLHLGSLIAALASYLHAHSNKGQWLVRMEDLDPPREVPGAADSILQSLDAHGLAWHGTIMYQSHRLDAYQGALELLHQRELVYQCNCTRARLTQLGGIYDGHCRSQDPISEPFAWRLQVADKAIAFNDIWQSRQSQNLNDELGDYILKRKDGLFAYQLAVVVDDIEQGVNCVIRGSDLLDSTPRQLYLFGLLANQCPEFGHIPVIENELGQKFSKQNHAPALNNSQASKNLCLALQFLNQKLPKGMINESPDVILKWAVEHFQPQQIQQTMGIAANSLNR